MSKEIEEIRHWKAVSKRRYEIIKKQFKEIEQLEKEVERLRNYVSRKVETRDLKKYSELEKENTKLKERIDELEGAIKMNWSWKETQERLTK